MYSQENLCMWTMVYAWMLFLDCTCPWKHQCAQQQIHCISNRKALRRHCQNTQHWNCLESLSLSLSLSTLFFLSFFFSFVYQYQCLKEKRFTGFFLVDAHDGNIRKMAEYLGHLKSKFCCILCETVTLFAKRSTVELKHKSYRGKCLKFSEVFLVVSSPISSLSLSNKMAKRADREWKEDLGLDKEMNWEKMRKGEKKKRKRRIFLVDTRNIRKQTESGWAEVQIFCC